MYGRDWVNTSQCRPLCLVLTSEVYNLALVCINYNLPRQVSSIPNLERNKRVQCVHCIVAPTLCSFENGTDVWFVHLRG